MQGNDGTGRQDSFDVVQLLHNNARRPTLHRLLGMTIRVNVPDHRPPHVDVVLADRRGALVDLQTLAVLSKTVRASEISQALAWIEASRAHAVAVFKESNG